MIVQFQGIQIRFSKFSNINLSVLLPNLFVNFFSQLFKDRNLVTQLVRRAENAGFKAIVLTADSPVIGRREAGIKNRLVIIGKFQLDYKVFYFKNIFSGFV